MKYSHSIIKMVYIYLGTNLDGEIYILDSSPFTVEEHRPRKISGVGRRRREADLRRTSRLRQIFFSRWRMDYTMKLSYNFTEALGVLAYLRFLVC